MSTRARFSAACKKSSRPGNSILTWHCAALIFVGLAMGGCWDRVELNDLGIVEGVALDRAGPHSIEVTLSLVVPAQVRPPGAGGGAGGGAAAPPTTLKTSQGRTVMDAVGTMQEKLSRRLFWAHTTAILIGEDLARDGVAPALDFFSRERRPRLRAVVAVVPGKASDILAAIPAIDKMPALFVGKSVLLHSSVAVTVRDFLTMLTSEGQEPVAARVEVVEAASKEPGDLEPGRTGTAAAAAGFHRQPGTTGAALFKGDRLLGYLDDHLTRGMLWLRDELRTATVTVTLAEPGKWVSFELMRSKTVIKPRFLGERLVMEIVVTTEDDLLENAAGVDSSDPEVIRLLEAELAETIAARIREAAEVVQKQFRTDVLRFGETVRRADPRRWKELGQRWDELFPEVELDLKVKAFIRRTGLSTKPLGLRKGELLKAEELKQIMKGR